MNYAKLFIGIVVMAVLAGLAFVFFRSAGTISFTGGGSGVSGTNGSGASSAVPVRQVPAGYKEYRDTTYRFSLFYPDNLAVKTYDEGGGASTITFQNTKTVEGFQMFIVPYSEPQVSETRFKHDEPSGIRNGMQSATINGTNAATFYSKDTRLANTYEVWFIHGGYLYEVTTLKPLDTWLQGIMQSWEFTP